MLPFPVILGEQVWIFVPLKMGKIEGDTNQTLELHCLAESQKQGTEAENLDRESQDLGLNLALQKLALFCITLIYPLNFSFLICRMGLITKFKLCGVVS